MDEQKITEKLEQGRNFILKWWEKSNEKYDSIRKAWQFIIPLFGGFLVYVIINETGILFLGYLWLILFIVWRFSYLISKNKPQN